jgi:UDPglucose--hexose-1-phosphate uridylyltransferase
MSAQSWQQVPHRRFNPLERRWVLVSPHRTQRPWQGEVAKLDATPRVHYDPQCYLCPGNERAGGHKNPAYAGTFIFDNDYAALLPDTRFTGQPPHDALFCAEPERGLCRVLCFSPDHSLTVARMRPAELERVVEAWSAQYAELGSRPDIRYVEIFENRGAMMGASNPHPHGQIWATEHVPDTPRLEGESQRAYRAEHGSCLLCDYVARETQAAGRIVCENEEFVAVVPFWAVWPFETMILSRAHMGAMPEFSQKQRAALASLMQRLTTRYDNLFSTSFPYTMGFHQAPTDGAAHPEWHFHAHYYPPLLRSATVRKFMVGFEMLGMPQRDITPESAAERLHAQSETHFDARP